MLIVHDHIDLFIPCLQMNTPKLVVQYMPGMCAHVSQSRCYARVFGVDGRTSQQGYSVGVDESTLHGLCFMNFISYRYFICF